MSEVRCSGHERSLGECRFQDAERSGCRHEADAAVRCHMPHMDFQSQVSPCHLLRACGAPAPLHSPCPPGSVPGADAQSIPQGTGGDTVACRLSWWQKWSCREGRRKRKVGKMFSWMHGAACPIAAPIGRDGIMPHALSQPLFPRRCGWPGVAAPRREWWRCWCRCRGGCSGVQCAVHSGG